MSAHLTEKLGLLVGGAALGAVSLAAYQKMQAKPAPVPIATTLPPSKAPVPGPSVAGPKVPNSSLDKLENAKRIMPFGSPGPINDLIYRNAYATSYNRRDRNPNWVAEHMTAESLTRGKGVDRSNSTFKEDEAIPAQFRARLSDYYKSNFDRGHMVAAADVKNSQQSMDETFYLTNIAPQVGEGFNRDYWAHVENFCRSLTKNFQDVYVYTGPLYLPHKEADGKFYVKYQVIGNPPNVAVPTHFFKVILTQKNGNYSAAAFVLPNARISDNTPLEAFRVPIDAVERGAGLTFFNGMGEAKNSLRDLCKDTQCKIVLSKYHEAQKKALPAP
ncbi:nuclease [Umbelopsis nana]